MAHWLEAQLKQYGVTTELRPLGSQNLDGKTIELPPAILGRIGDDPKKKTVLVYGHFDVQPVRNRFFTRSVSSNKFVKPPSTCDFLGQQE